jgi:hypothetical protein
MHTYFMDLKSFYRVLSHPPLLGCCTWFVVPCLPCCTSFEPKKQHLADEKCSSLGLICPSQDAVSKVLSSRRRSFASHAFYQQTQSNI